MNDKIILRNMVFYGFHGAYEFEREVGQRFYIDLEIRGDFRKAGRSDNMKDTLDYVSIYAKTKEITKDNRFTLLEALGARIAEEILAMSSIVHEVSVRVRKPTVPIAGAIDYVEIEITRTR